MTSYGEIRKSTTSVKAAFGKADLSHTFVILSMKDRIGFACSEHRALRTTRRSRKTRRILITMPTVSPIRALAGLIAAVALPLSAFSAIAQDPAWGESPYRPQGQVAAGQPSTSYAEPAYNGQGGYGTYQPSQPSQRYSAAPSNDAYSSGYAPSGSNTYQPGPRSGYPQTGYPQSAYPQNDAYSPPQNGTYSAGPSRGDSFTEPGEPAGNGGGPGYGTPYTAAPSQPPSEGSDHRGSGAPYSGATYEQGEIIAAGHGFFGALSKGLANAVEYAFQSQGRPNGYILGEDAGGAFVLGLRYGEGRLYTKDAGDHRVYWQGPSVGYDAGAEGSKTMVLVYNLRDPSEIYNRFGGVQGSVYLVGGVSVQFQTYNDVTLGIIRSGVGVRLGANIGYLKYTRTPTWNPL